MTVVGSWEVKAQWFLSISSSSSSLEALRLIFIVSLSLSLHLLDRVSGLEELTQKQESHGTWVDLSHWVREEGRIAWSL